MIDQRREEALSPQTEERANPWKPGARMGIIGGQGEMGSLFAGFFRRLGYRVEIADRLTEKSNEEVARDADIVLFSVPLHRTVEIVRSLLPCIRPHQLLMDLTSLKGPPVREMLESPAAVLGLHPMFGGRISTFEGQTLVACPVRIPSPAWAEWKALFTGQGLRVKESTPEAHDRMMSIIQVLFHMTTMLAGRILRDLEVDIGETLEYTSPVYRLEMSLLGRIFAQDPALYSAITQMNPHTGDLIQMLSRGLEQYRKWYEEADLEAFVEDFERSAGHLNSFTDWAYEESSAMLEFAARWRKARHRPEASIPPGEAPPTHPSRSENKD